MSYPRPNTGNFIKDYYLALDDFLMLSHHLLEAETEQGFLVWMEKLLLIDQHALMMFLRKHRDEIRPEFMRLAQWQLRGRI